MYEFMINSDIDDLNTNLEKTYYDVLYNGESVTANNRLSFDKNISEYGWFKIVFDDGTMVEFASNPSKRPEEHECCGIITHIWNNTEYELCVSYVDFDLYNTHMWIHRCFLQSLQYGTKYKETTKGIITVLGRLASQI